MKTWPAAFLIVSSLESFASAGGGSGLSVRYVCTGNARIQATYAGQHARVVVDGQVLEMTTGLSASGARYVGGGYTWWTKGHTAELYRGEDPGQLTSLRRCQQG